MTDNNHAIDSGEEKRTVTAQEAEAVAGPESEGQRIDHHRKNNEKEIRMRNGTHSNQKCPHKQRSSLRKMFEKQVL